MKGGPIKRQSKEGDYCFVTLFLSKPVLLGLIFYIFDSPQKISFRVLTFELLLTLSTTINKGVVKIKQNLFPIFDQKKMTSKKIINIIKRPVFPKLFLLIKYSLMVSMTACYWGGPGFKSWQGR